MTTLLPLLVLTATAAEVTVEDPGGGNRRLLRYDIPNGTRQRVSLTVAAELTTTEAQADRPPTTVQMPRATATLDLRTTRRADGNFAVSLLVHHIDVKAGSDPGQNAVFERDLAVLSGQQGVLTVTPAGEVTQAELAPAIDAPADGRKQPFDLRELSVRLPDSPVGVGAIWSYDKAPALVSGVEVTRHVVCQLESVRGRTAEISVQITEHGQPGQVPLDDPTGLASLRVDALDALGAARHVVRLNRPAVVDGHGSLDMSVATTAEVMGVSMSVAQRIVIHSTLTAVR